MKNALAIDPARVLNFYTVCGAWDVYNDYTCNYSAPLLGYAFFPRDFPENSTRHGVVVKYTTLPGGSEPDHDQGIVAVHEVGHFVGLFHTFEGGCEGGDGIADTPPEQYPSYECVERNSCIEPPPDPWDPIHNYMDYSPDVCRYEFTPLQADAMYGVMSRWRPTMTGLVIVVDQWNETNNVMVGSTISRWEAGWADYTVGNDEPKLRFFPGTSEYLRGYQGVLLSPTEKYHKWRSSSDVTNYHRFDITTDFFSRQTSQFKRTHDATIEARFIDGGSGDSINFTDPWFIDFNDPTYGMRNQGLQAVPHPVNSAENNLGISTNYKGVFLNQDYNVPGQPYYSVAAPNTATINGIQSAFFIKWSGQNVTFQDSFALQTPLVFTAGNARASATYKAHLASSLAGATGSNSQRKMVSNDGATYTLAYESAGSVWKTSSTDGGSTWLPEERVGTSASAPSVAYTSTLVLAPTEIEEASVIFRQPNDPNYYEIWEGGRKVNTTNIAVEWNPHPVMGQLYAVDSRQMLAIWESGVDYQTPGPLKFSYKLHDGHVWGTWQSEQSVPGSNPGDRNPSLAAVYIDQATMRRLYMSYDNGSDVLFTSYGSEPAWETTVAVPASVVPPSFSSQIASDVTSGHESEDRVHIVWEALNDSKPQTDGGDSWSNDNSVPTPKHTVMYQQFIDGWSGAHEFINAYGDFYHPSVTQLASGTVLMVWDDGTCAYKAVNDGSEWTITEVYQSGIYPNLLGSGPNGLLEASRFVFTAPTGTPHALGFSSTEGAQREESRLEMGYERVAQAGEQPNGAVSSVKRGAFALSLSSLILKLSDGTLLPLEFVQVDDSTLAINEENAWEKLATQPVTLSATIDSIFVKGAVQTVAPGRISRGQGLRLWFELVEAENGTIIRTVGTERTLVNDSISVLRIGERLRGLAGRRVIVRPVVKGCAHGRKDIVYALVHRHIVKPGSRVNAPTSLAHATQQPVEQVPSVFAFHEGYPNPFNPATTIKYDLPEPSHVSLVIYDVLGRKVAELENGMKEAGYHSALWNASDVASGVYFARFTATNADGNVKLNKVTKLLLTK